MKMSLFLLFGFLGLWFWIYFEDSFIRIIGLVLIVVSLVIKRKM